MIQIELTEQDPEDNDPVNNDENNNTDGNDSADNTTEEDSNSTIDANTDTDGDGVIDTLDACPNTASVLQWRIYCHLSKTSMMKRTKRQPIQPTLKETASKKPMTQLLKPTKIMCNIFDTDDCCGNCWCVAVSK